MSRFGRGVCLVFILLLSSWSGLTANAQEPDLSRTPPATSAELAPPDDVKENQTTSSGGSLVGAPLPISSPAIGSGIIPVVAYLFPLQKNDKKSPTSLIGAAGLFTDNGSRALAFAGELYFGQNTYKATAAYLRGNLNYDVYGPSHLRAWHQASSETNGTGVLRGVSAAGVVGRFRWAAVP